MSRTTARPWDGLGVALVEHPRNYAATRGLSAALSLGLKIVLLTNDAGKYANMSKSFRAEDFYILESDTADAQEIQHRVKANPFSLHAVTSFSHHYCHVAAVVAMNLGLTGPSPEFIEKAVNKDLMRLALMGERYSLPFAVVDDVEGLLSVMDRIEGPVVLKPRAETSSLAVIRADDRVTAVEAFHTIQGRRFNRQGQPQDGRVLVEQAVDGPEFSVELLSRDGTTTCLGVTEKLPLATHAYVEQADTLPMRGNSSLAAELEQAAKSALEWLGGGFGMCHVEVRNSGLGPKIIEVNPRQGGGQLPTLLELTTGRNVFVDTLALLLRSEPPQTYEPVVGAATWWQIYAPKSGTLRSSSGLSAIGSHASVRHAELSVRLGSRVQVPTSNIDCLGGFVVVADSPEESLGLARDLASLVHLDVV